MSREIRTRQSIAKTWALAFLVVWAVWVLRALVLAPQTLIWVLFAWPYAKLSIVVCVSAGLVHTYFGRSLRKVSIIAALATALYAASILWGVFQHCTNYAERGFPVDGLGLGLGATFLSLVVTLGAVTSMVMIFASAVQQSGSADVETINSRRWTAIGFVAFVLSVASFYSPFYVCYAY